MRIQTGILVEPGSDGDHISYPALTQPGSSGGTIATRLSRCRVVVVMLSRVAEGEGLRARGGRGRRLAELSPADVAGATLTVVADACGHIGAATAVLGPVKGLGTPKKKIPKKALGLVPNEPIWGPIITLCLGPDFTILVNGSNSYSVENPFNTLIYIFEVTYYIYYEDVILKLQING